MRRLVLALALALALARLATAQDLTDAEDVAVRMLELLSDAQSNYKFGRDDPRYATLEELLASKKLEGPLRCPGYAFSSKPSADAPESRFWGRAVPQKAGLRHFFVNQNGEVLASKDVIKFDLRSCEPAAKDLPRVQSSARRKARDEARAAEAERLAKLRPATARELDAVDALEAIYRAEMAHFASATCMASLDELKGRLDPEVAAGAVPGFKIAVHLTPGVKRPASFVAIAEPETKDENARWFARGLSFSGWLARPIELDAKGEPKAKLEEVAALVARTEKDASAERPLEYSAKQLLRSIPGSQAIFLDMAKAPDGKRRYGTFQELVDAALVSDALRSGKAWGYVFDAGPAGESYWASAIPEKPESGARAFFLDGKGRLHASAKAFTVDPKTGAVPEGLAEVGR